jgi:hypothetical protein
MKYLLFLIPFNLCAQDIIWDTLFIDKIGQFYYLTNESKDENETILIKKQLIGDSLSAIEFLIKDAENQSANMQMQVKFLQQGIKNRRKIQELNQLHQQITGQTIYFSTSKKYQAIYQGEYDLTINKVLVKGEIKINNNGRLIFAPFQEYRTIIANNFVINPLAGQLFFSLNGINYELYRINNNRFMNLDRDVILIKTKEFETDSSKL